MLETAALFQHKKANADKLKAFGFRHQNCAYVYEHPLTETQLLMTVTIDADGMVTTCIRDPESGDEYLLHRLAETAGPFVGMVRSAHDELLEKIAQQCFEPDVFRSTYAQKVIDYIDATYHDQLEFLWPKFPHNAVWRRQDTHKWYGALLLVHPSKLGLDGTDDIEIIDLRMEPGKLAELLDNQKYFPGYHMNKKHWYTVCLNGTVPLDELFLRIDESYLLAVK